MRKYLAKTELAREMRHNPSPPEAIMWGFLQHRFPRVFHRQMVMVGYIADFYAPAHQLVVEVDGSQHLEPDAQQYDRVRDAAMRKRGFTVVRFPSCRVFNEIERVLLEIEQIISRPGFSAESRVTAGERPSPVGVPASNQSPRDYARPGCQGASQSDTMPRP